MEEGKKCLEEQDECLRSFVAHSADVVEKMCPEVTSLLKQEVLKREQEIEKFITKDLVKDIPTGIPTFFFYSCIEKFSCIHLFCYGTYYKKIGFKVRFNLT